MATGPVIKYRKGGGGKIWGVGASEVLPLRKGGGRVVLAMLQWGEHDKFRGSFKIYVKQKGRGAEGVTFYPFLGGGLR